MGLWEVGLAAAHALGPEFEARLCGLLGRPQAYHRRGGVVRDSWAVGQLMIGLIDGLIWLDVGVQRHATGNVKSCCHVSPGERSQTTGMDSSRPLA